MSLQNKYQQLIDVATSTGVTQLDIKESQGVLYINGIAPNGNVKQQLWDMYEKIDPNFTSGDLILNIDAQAGVAEGSQLKVTTSKSNLNIRKGPGTDQEVIGKAAHAAIVTLLKKENDQWWFIKTQDGIEGYCFTQYLTPLI